MARSVDLADELKQMVDSGQATATRTMFDGIPAWKLRLPTSTDTLLNSATAYVAQSDYRPLEIDSTRAKIVLSTYQHVPATPTNDALLAVTTAHPGATVVNETPSPPSPRRRRASGGAGEAATSGPGPESRAYGDRPRLKTQVEPPKAVNHERVATSRGDPLRVLAPLLLRDEHLGRGCHLSCKARPAGDSARPAP